MLVRNSIVMVVALCASATAASAGEYVSPNSHFTVSIPVDWVEISGEELKTFNTLVAQRGQSIRYEAGFRPKGSRPGTYPYVLIQVISQNMGGASYDELEKTLSRDLGVAVKQNEKVFSDLGGNVNLGTATLDRARNRVIIPLKMDVFGAGKIQGLSIGHLGSEGLVLLHSYASEKEFDKWLPTFELMNDSFNFDNGHEFTAGTGSTGTSFSMTNAMRAGIIGGVVGAIAAGLGALFRKEKKPEPRFRSSDFV